MCKFFRKASFSSYVQQYNWKQLNQLILCPFDAKRLAGGKGAQKVPSSSWTQVGLTVFCCIVVRGFPWKFAHFVLFHLIKKHSFSFNLLCVLDLFSQRWESTLFQAFSGRFTLFKTDTESEYHQLFKFLTNYPTLSQVGSQLKLIHNNVECLWLLELLATFPFSLLIRISRHNTTLAK